VDWTEVLFDWAVCAFRRTVVPPIKPANAAAKASDFTELFMGICLSLVEPRLTAWAVEVDCERIAARPESKFQ
jgi:hypothetical protein